jgi:hypothetical protein
MYRDLANRVTAADPEHPLIVPLLDKVAEWQGRTGDPAGALRLLARARGQALQLLGPDDPNIPVIDENIAFWSHRLTVARGHNGR